MTLDFGYVASPKPKLQNTVASLSTLLALYGRLPSQVEATIKS